LTIEKSKGLSDVQLRSLLEELNKLSSNLKGEVMIFELAQHVQSFLHQNNKPGFKSFYDEMMIAQQQREQMKLRDKQVKEEREVSVN
jgi:eukaryotic translation initiation factor 2-alpha kinase 4